MKTSIVSCAGLARAWCFATLPRSFQWSRALPAYPNRQNMGGQAGDNMCTSDFLGRGLNCRSFASNAAASASSSDDDGLQLTENAIRRLQELQSEAPDKPLLLRLTVEGGGCSGFQYEFSLDSASKPEDRVFEIDGAKLVTDDLSMEFLNGSVVDFESDLMRSGFVVAGNPNAASSCGCGSSFVAK